ncbi:MAG TPA: PilN domain-containing protein [Gaiellaceae bacterium]|nr:PilN domain-containing protein [Gaiellaceae bacterium]
MKAVNLLPKDDRRRGGPNIPPALAATAIGGFTVVMAALALLFVTAHGTVKSRRLELEQKKQELAAIPVPAQNQLAQQDALVSDKKARVTALNAALSRRVAWDRVLREFALVLPDDVWLENLTAAAPTAATATTATLAAPSSNTGSLAAGEQGFTIEGYTYSHDAVARLLTRLAVIPDLEQVQLVTSEQAKVNDRPIVHFKISANVRAPGATS